MRTCAREGCGKPLMTRATGRPAKYCSTACRVAALRGALGRPAANTPEVDVTTAARNETRLRGSYGRDFGDGDRCPRDPAHGSMYFMKPAMTRQWCPSSEHLGSPFYERDGVTPATRPAAQADPAAALTGRVPGLDPEPQIGSPAVTAADPSLPAVANARTGSQPTRLRVPMPGISPTSSPAVVIGSPLAVETGGGQLALGLAVPAGAT